ncbi:MAG: VWA domain-containing protein [candidate division Zixibacteria bacterium]|nr:VWA domain-containing protein [candidate division Zixibacteria bacterium]
MKRAYMLTLALILIFGSTAMADGFIIPMPPRPHEPFPPNLSIKYHHVDIKIDNQIAQTAVDQVFINNYHRDIEGTFIFPIPEDASISKFSMFVGGEEIKGKVLDREEARRIYEDIVRRKKDPALLEYFKDRMFKARVYPIPAHGETRIKLDYSEMLKLNGGICGYRYTLNTEKFSKDPLQSVKLTVQINSKQPIKSIYSPSHNIKIDKENDHKVRVTYVEENTRPDKDFLLYYTVSEEDIGFNLLPYEDEDHQRYFLAMISPQVEVPADKTLRKEIIFILDTSGSMRGEKIRQAKGALTFCLNSLNPNDRFNIVDFDDQIRSFKESLTQATRENIKDAQRFVESCEAEGGTNINDALLTGLRQIGTESRAPLIIFLTDGLPTVGLTDIKNILQNVKESNRARVRVFVFGVGYDVNAHFLDKLAQDNHATSDYVSPDEDIEVKVSSFFKKVSHPILTDIELSFTNVETFDIYPKELPDIFKGSQLLLLGKYKGKGSSAVILSGSAEDAKERFTYEVDFSPNEKNDFIPRLWATRRIGYLVDELRLHGENKELIDEVVRLSKKYGIINQYTSFLIDADYRLAHEELALDAARNIRMLSKEQVGAGAVGQARTLAGAKKAQAPMMGYFDSKGKYKKIEKVAQAGTRTFFNKNGLWVDSEYEGKLETIKVERFSQAYFKLLSRLPEIGKYLALGDKVIFLLNGKAIEISDQGKADFTESELKALLSG